MTRDENDRLKAGEPIVDSDEDLREAIPPESAQRHQRHRCTDLGNGRRFAAKWGQDTRYVAEWAEWLTWSGTLWERDSGGQAVRLLAQRVPDDIRADARQLDTEADDAATGEEAEDLRSAAKNLRKWAHQSEGTGRISATLREAQCQPPIPLRAEQLDAAEVLVCADATIDLRTLKPRESRREDLATKRSPVAWQWNATCPRWIAFLEWALCGDAELIGYVQRAVGYTLTADTSEQCFFFLHGGGANGKGTFLAVIQHMLGKYGVTMPNTLLVERGPAQEQHPAQYARLLGARAAFGEDLVGSGTRWNESALKQLTGEQVIPARGMRENFFDVKPTWKMWLAANHKPSVTGGGDYALWRRVRLIPFLAKREVGDRDPRLREKLLAEAPGILAWAVEGLRLWREQGLGTATAIEEAVKAYRDQADVIGQFIEECCEVGPHFSVHTTELYRRYAAWAKELGHRPIADNTLGAQLEDRQFPAAMSNGKRKRKGLRLLDDGSMFTGQERRDYTGWGES